MLVSQDDCPFSLQLCAAFFKNADQLRVGVCDGDAATKDEVDCISIVAKVMNSLAFLDFVQFHFSED